MEPVIPVATVVAVLLPQLFIMFPVEANEPPISFPSSIKLAVPEPANMIGQATFEIVLLYTLLLLLLPETLVMSAPVFGLPVGECFTLLYIAQELEKALLREMVLF